MGLVFFSKILILGTSPSWPKNFGDVVKKGSKPGIRVFTIFGAEIF